VQERLPLTDSAAETILAGRNAIRAILERKDPRLFIVSVRARSMIRRRRSTTRAACGVCRRGARHAGARDARLFEKPRTSIGWKGFVNDPRMDDSFRIDEGILRARELLMQLAEIGLPTASEALDPICPQYLSELISWYAIGARTDRVADAPRDGERSFRAGRLQERHGRRARGGDQCDPVGGAAARFSRRESGGKDERHPLDRKPARPPGPARRGRAPELRYRQRAPCRELARAAKLPLSIVVDCSHANSMKDHALQPLVFNDCVHQILEGNRSIVGLMIESNLEAGNQPIPDDLSKLRYGVSVTDPCIDWRTTEEVCGRAHRDLGPVLERRKAA
jgi:3-deoxy-7-phosphoheptulonate synthase